MELLIKRVLDTLAEVGESEMVALLTLRDHEYCVLDGGFAAGNFVETGQVYSYLDTPLEEVVRSREAGTYPCVLRDGLPFPSYTPSPDLTECLCMPLQEENADVVIGVAVIAQPASHKTPDYRMQILNILRTLVSAAMENARLFQLATMDSLTGLYMRRYFEIRLEEELRRVHRHRMPLSLIMLDIDFFKRVNDTYGHLQGDNVLCEVARIILDSVRVDIDLPCRYGGEEFIILLPSTPLDGACVLAERIRKRCEEHAFMMQDQPIQVTLSIGVAEMKNEDDFDRHSFIGRADAMLYAAKQGGRNQVRH